MLNNQISSKCKVCGLSGNLWAGPAGGMPLHIFNESHDREGGGPGEAHWTEEAGPQKNLCRPKHQKGSRPAGCPPPQTLSLFLFVPS